MTLRRSALVAGLMCALGNAASAAPIFVPNHSFEDPDLKGDIGLGNSVQSVPQWTQTVISLFPSFAVFDPSDSQFPNTTGDNAPLPGTAEGGQAAVIDAGGKGSLTTALPVATTMAGQVYTLTVALGDDLNTTEQPGLVTIELLVDGVTSALASITGASLPNGTFIDLSTSFVATLDGQALAIRLSQETIGFNAFAWFDNVRLERTPTIAIAEPLGAALMAIALLGWGVVRGSTQRRVNAPSPRSARRCSPRPACCA